MRTTYTTAWWSMPPETEYVDGRQASITVFDPDTSARKTGILDKNGEMLFAVTRPNPIGFTAEIDD